MKIRAPDDFETSKDNKSEANVIPTEENNEFVKEIKDILEMPKMSSKFVAEESDHNSVQYKLEVLRKFTALCREEILPRHNKAADTIQAKSNEVNRMHLIQQKDLSYLLATLKELEESRDKLKSNIENTQITHQQLSERLKEVLSALKNHCRNKTLAERKMAQDLENYKEKAKDYSVKIIETKAKVNYYTSQSHTQAEEVTRHAKPLYLDKNRAVFLRSNLKSMSENIENLVSRVKTLKIQMAQLEEHEIEDNVKD